ncbi:MAG TPA: DUF6268 family outer membrane beta-barrel protein [Pirellulales bacterium]
MLRAARPIFALIATLTIFVAPALGQSWHDDEAGSRTTTGPTGRSNSGRYGATIRRGDGRLSEVPRRTARTLNPLRERQLDLSTDTLPPPRPSASGAASPSAASSSLRRQAEELAEPRLLPGPIDPFDPDFGTAAPQGLNDPLPFGATELDLSPPDDFELRPGGDFYVAQPQEPLARQALKMFVRNTFRTTYLPAPSGADRIEMLDIEGNNSVAMPWSKPENAFVLTPGFGVHMWQGPEAIPVPGTLYDFYMDVLWRFTLRDRWSIDLAVTPGAYSDLDHGEDAFRLMARGAVSYQLNPQFQLTAGAAYLNIASVKVLPIVGFVWEPRDNIRIEALAPQPKLFYRVAQYGEQSGWAYLSGEFSGGQWAITMPDGDVDKLSYQDFRVLGGFEWRMSNRVRAYAEGGYAFGRKLRLVEADQELDIEDSFVFRVGTFY